MKRIISILISFLVISCVGQAAETNKNWEDIPVGTIDNLEIRLLYRSMASLADEEWMQLEFKNKGNESIQITNANYRIDSIRFSPDGKTQLSSGGLASGNTYDLFPYAWETTPVSDIVILPGSTYTVTEHLSRYSSALLGLPLKEGLVVKALFFIDIELAKKKRLSLSSKGIPFTFMWQYPDANDFIYLKQRLMSLLQQPESKAHHCHSYVLGTLLKIPEISNDLSIEEISAAIDLRHGGFDGREDLIEYLETRNFERKKIIDSYHLRLNRMDTRVCDDLLHSQKIWDATFIEPLIIMHEQDTKSPPFKALAVLARHSEDWNDNSTITHRLSAVLLERRGMFLKLTPDELIAIKRLEHWAMDVRDLSLTRDRDILTLLTPFLDWNTQIYDHRWSVPNIPGSLPASYRMCDIALDAILTILDGEVKKGYQIMGIPLSVAVERKMPNGKIFQIETSPTIEQMTIWRDSIIPKVKERLATLKPTNEIQ